MCVYMYIYIYTVHVRMCVYIYIYIYIYIHMSFYICTMVTLRLAAEKIVQVLKVAQKNWSLLWGCFKGCFMGALRVRSSDPKNRVTTWVGRKGLLGFRVEGVGIRCFGFGTLSP